MTNLIEEKIIDHLTDEINDLIDTYESPLDSPYADYLTYAALDLDDIRKKLKFVIDVNALSDEQLLKLIHLFGEIKTESELIDDDIIINDIGVFNEEVEIEINTLVVGLDLDCQEYLDGLTGAQRDDLFNQLEYYTQDGFAYVGITAYFAYVVDGESIKEYLSEHKLPA